MKDEESVFDRAHRLEHERTQAAQAALDDLLAAHAAHAAQAAYDLFTTMSSAALRQLAAANRADRTGAPAPHTLAVCAGSEALIDAVLQARGERLDEGADDDEADDGDEPPA